MIKRNMRQRQTTGVQAANAARHEKAGFEGTRDKP